MFVKLINCLIITFIGVIIGVLLINASVVLTTKNNIITEDDAININDIDCILILGAGIRGKSPSPMLEDRLLQGISLYNDTYNKIIVSGDHMNKDYDEVNVMKDYLISKDIPSNDIFMDHAGISTYDSIYRAKHFFDAKRIIIITQEYHLYRALYIAENLNIEAYGITSNPREYYGQTARDIREILARTKDYFKVLFKLKSTYLGDKISLNDNGNITNDK